jgi:hypothetical protein
VHRELLSRKEDVRVDDRGLDERPAVDRLRSGDERRVVQERSHVVACVVAVRVGLAEVVGPRGQLRDVGPSSEPPAGAQEIQDGVVPLRKPVADLHRRRLLRVHLVAPEPLAERHHRLGLGRREERLEQDVTMGGHRTETYGRRRPAVNP